MGDAQHMMLGSLRNQARELRRHVGLEYPQLVRARVRHGGPQAPDSLRLIRPNESGELVDRIRVPQVGGIDIDTEALDDNRRTATLLDRRALSAKLARQLHGGIALTALPHPPAPRELDMVVIPQQVQPGAGTGFAPDDFEPGPLEPDPLGAQSIGLRDSVDLELMQTALLSVAYQTMQPSQLSLWIRESKSDHE